MNNQTKETQEARTALRYIAVHKINPHPDNPRKELGDLAELSDSIRNNGILQNLTVVPYVGEETHEVIEGLYRCIIGHRRLAAAKMAGLDTVPCVVAQMTPADQIKTMLMENMQRSDLSPVEQADGFQMMLDLGVSFDEVVYQSGFSQSTIRRRLKLRELDRQKLEERVTQGATLMDLAKLEQIDDLKTRNKVLETVGTNNFGYELSRAMDAQKIKNNKLVWEELLSTFAETLSNEETGKREWNYCAYHNLSKSPSEFEMPEDAKIARYGYKIEGSALTLYQWSENTGGEGDQSDEYKARKSEIEETNAALKAVNDVTRALRQAYIKAYPVRKKDVPIITNFLLMTLANPHNSANSDILGKFLDVPEGLGWSEERKVREEKFLSLLAEDPDKALLFMAYAAAGDSGNKRYVDFFYEKFPVFCEDSSLDAIYDFLELLGYQISDQERLLMSGKHPLLQLEDEKEQEDCPGEDEYDD